VSFQGRRVSSGTYDEGGIYIMSITFDGSGIPRAGTPSLVVSTSEYVWNGFPGSPDVLGYDFSPLGSDITYCRGSDRLIVIYNRIDNTEEVLSNPTTCGGYIGWSVQNEILFWKSSTYGIARINIDGSNETDLVVPEGSLAAGRVYWSPDGNYIVYGYQMDWSSFRVDRNGHGTTAVDSLLGVNEPLGWR